MVMVQERGKTWSNGQFFVALPKLGYWYLSVITVTAGKRNGGRVRKIVEDHFHSIWKATLRLSATTSAELYWRTRSPGAVTKVALSALD